MLRNESISVELINLCKKSTDHLRSRSAFVPQICFYCHVILVSSVPAVQYTKRTDDKVNICCLFTVFFFSLSNKMQSPKHNKAAEKQVVLKSINVWVLQVFSSDQNFGCSSIANAVFLV